MSPEHSDYIVHFPVKHESLPLLAGIEGLILVGSMQRAARLTEYLTRFRTGVWKGGKMHIYCHLPQGDTDREYSFFIIEWDQPRFKIGIISHGIGAAGVEIVLAECTALIALASDKTTNPVKAVIRCGTRGSIDPKHPIGTIALSSEVCQENLELDNADPVLLETLKQSSHDLNLSVAEGRCFSSQFFWMNQGRCPFPLLTQYEELDRDQQDFLHLLRKKDICWVEMEDYYVCRIAKRYGIAAAGLGVVVASRFDPDSKGFVLSYDRETKKTKELLPGEIALLSLYNFLHGQ
ncbi:MAG: hypothetical protein SFT81_03920 [Candidatus Caenarcaniphilales bacterium]|nr:hypothetical protein [Candidatus Caenarcaniphilales bacterium]